MQQGQVSNQTSRGFSARGWGSERTLPEERGPVKGPLRRKAETDRVREEIS